MAAKCAGAWCIFGFTGLQLYMHRNALPKAAFPRPSGYASYASQLEVVFIGVSTWRVA